MKRRMMTKSEAARDGDTLILELPQELVLEIMRRVPVKCVLELRCVCKSWKSLILEPQFMDVSIQRTISDMAVCTSRAIDGLDAIRSFLHSVVDTRDFTVGLFEYLMRVLEIVGAELQQVKRGLRLQIMFLKIQNSR